MESGQLVAGTRPAARPWLVCAAVATVLAAAWLALAPAARAACPAPAGSNAIVVENCQAGKPAQRVGHLGRRRHEHPGLRDRHQRQPGRDRSASRSSTPATATGSTSTGWATTAATARARSRPSTRRPAVPQNQPACLRRLDRSRRLRQLGASPRPGRCPPRRRVRHLLRPPRAHRRPGDEPHLLRRAQRRARSSDIYYQTSDTTWQAYNDYGGNSLYEGGPLSAAAPRALQGQLQPALHHPRRSRAARTGSSTPSTRWSAGWSATATTSATRPASTPTATAR